MMERLSTKAPAFNQPYTKDVLITSAAWRTVISCLPGAFSFPSSLQRASARLMSSQSRFLDGRKRRRKHRHGHRLTAGVLILSSFSPPPQSSPRSLRCPHHCDGTVDHHHSQTTNFAGDGRTRFHLSQDTYFLSIYSHAIVTGIKIVILFSFLCVLQSSG